jgi:hypothetical protein
MSTDRLQSIISEFAGCTHEQVVAGMMKLPDEDFNAICAELLDEDKWSVPQSPTERQSLFLGLTDEREVFYGGAAGGGKSSALLIAALEYVHIPGYAALLLRKTYADLSKPGALMDRAQQWLHGKAHWSDKTKTWTFPSGATLSFGYLETENDKYQYQGAEFQFCVERDTPILMGDGSYKPIHQIEVGDAVATLQGIRSVRRVVRVGRKPCVRVTNQFNQSTTISELHPFLTSCGWVSPLSLRPILYRDAYSIGESLREQLPESHTHALCSSGYQLPVEPPSPQIQQSTHRTATFASLVDGQNGFSAFDDLRRAIVRPQAWTARAILFAPALPLAASCNDDGYHQRGFPHALSASAFSSSDFDYRDVRDFCGELSLAISQATDLISIPLPDGAEASSHACLNLDGRDCIQEHSHLARCRYNHPYTKERLDSVENVLPSRVDISLAGEQEVWDLTVEHAAHYVTYGGIISRNCGFDELTQFSESAYLYLFSRLRRLETSDVPLRMRSASNPGGIGSRWVNERFVPDQFTPDQAKEARVFEKSGRAFVPARLDDNPHLDRVAYAESLNELDPVTREQLLRGDWQITERGNILSMWDENRHVITWTQFAQVFGFNHIPMTWLLGVYQDWGSTVDHPCVTSWFATVPANCPPISGVKMAGKVFLYRQFVTWDATVREVAEAINVKMGKHGEKSRTNRWQMSHEASSERLAYQREHGLPFVAWPTGKTRGIAQLRNALEPVEINKTKDPFNSFLDGHCLLYHVVADAQRVFPRDDDGLARHRAEAPAYKWAVLKSGEPTTALVPHALFNDAMDTVRAAGADYFPMVLPKTLAEKVDEAIHPSLTRDAIQDAIVRGENVTGKANARIFESARLEKELTPQWDDPWLSVKRRR